MAFLKVWRTFRQYGLRTALHKIVTVAPVYLGGIAHWSIRRCQCCERITIFVAHRNGSAEFRACLFCSANERYELLAAEIRARYGKQLSEMDVLELDSHSPLRTILAGSRSLTRSFYEEGCTVSERNGALLVDITALRFNEATFDLIVSSDVLEHVPFLERAFKETARVLKPGGAHLFTVPPRTATKPRAEIVNGDVHHLVPAEYHLDPLSPQGILAFWDIGPDLPTVLPTLGLVKRIVRGPTGSTGRIVWIAERV